MGAETGAVHGAGFPHLATFSAPDSALHRLPKILSLSALRRDVGSNGRCARQNEAYAERGTINASFLARGARAEPGGAGLFGVTRRRVPCSFSRHQRADGRLLGSPRNPVEWAMENGSAFAGALPETTAAARDPTAGCDVACSECVAEAGGSAVVEGLDAVGIMPLYAKPVLAAGRAAPQRGTLRTTSCSTAESPSELGGGLGEGDAGVECGPDALKASA